MATSYQMKGGKAPKKRKAPPVNKEAAFDVRVEANLAKSIRKTTSNQLSAENLVKSIRHVDMNPYRRTEKKKEMPMDPEKKKKIDQAVKEAKDREMDKNMQKGYERYEKNKKAGG